MSANFDSKLRAVLGSKEMLCSKPCRQLPTWGKLAYTGSQFRELRVLIYTQENYPGSINIHVVTKRRKS